MGFKGLGKSVGDLSQQLAQNIGTAAPGVTSSVQERSEEVYTGAVDGLSGADLNAVVEEFEHEAVVIKKAFQRALHRALGSVALLGELRHHCYVFVRIISCASMIAMACLKRFGCRPGSPLLLQSYLAVSVCTLFKHVAKACCLLYSSKLMACQLALSCAQAVCLLQVFQNSCIILPTALQAWPPGQSHLSEELASLCLVAFLCFLPSSSSLNSNR